MKIPSIGGAGLNQPVRRQIRLLMVTLTIGFVLVAALYLIASTVTGRIERQMNEYHLRAGSLADGIEGALARAQVPRALSLSRQAVTPIDQRMFAAEAIRSYEQILSLEGR